MWGCGRTDTRTNLTIWSAPKGVEEQGLLRLIKRFEGEHPNIAIHNVGGLEEPKLLRAIVAGAPPDLAYLYGTSDVGPLAANGGLTSLDRYYQAAGYNDGQFLSGIIDQHRYSGHLYAMPVTRDCHALYWNRSVFKKAGLDPDHPPQTMEELRQFALKLNKRRPDGSLEILGFNPLPEDQGMLLCALGGRLEDPDTHKVTANCPENVAALAWLVDFVDQLGGRDVVARMKSSFGPADSAQNPIVTGKVAMSIEGEWVAMYIEKHAPGSDYGVGEIPHTAAHPEQANMAWQDGDVMIVPAGAKHVEAAWEFMRWMQAPRQQEEYAAAMNNLPSVKSLMDSPMLTRGSRKNLALGYILQHIAGSSTNPRFFPTTPISRFYRDTLGTAIEAAELHSKTPKQALDDAQARIDQELARY